MRLTNKIVVLTGATGGIGSVLASHLAHADARLLLLGRDKSKLNNLATNLPHPERHLTFSCDLTNTTSLTRTAHSITRAYPRIDLVIHAAGVGIDKPFAKVAQADWDLSYTLNVKAPYFLTQLLLPSMSHSLVLAIGSRMGVEPTAGRSLYCPTKAALRSTFLTLAQEHILQGLEFCLITLGPVMTNFGNRTTEDRQVEAKQGKTFFSPEWVANKLVELIQADKHEPEYVLYPGDFGFGSTQTEYLVDIG